MRKIFIIITLLLAFHSHNISAQSKYSISIGGGYIAAIFEHSKLAGWDNNRYSINAASDYNITDRITIGVASSYQKYLFTGGGTVLTEPAVIGFNENIKGENSSVIELSFDGKFYAEGSFLKPYIVAGAGVLFVGQGKTEVTTWMVENNQIINKSTSGNSGKNYLLGQINFGFGIEINLISNLQLVIDGRVVDSFAGLIYCPVASGLKLVL